jgi:hypothetical protein
MPVINGVYLKDFTALPGAVADADIIPIAITGDNVAYRTTVAGIVTDARITAKLLTGLSVTGGAVVAADTILEAFGKVQNQINGKQGTVTLTTTGTSGVATLIANTLNIPQYQGTGNYITSLTGEATASGPGAAAVTLTNSAVIGKVLTGLNVTGGTVLAADSILDGFGKVQNQINGLIGGSIFQGTWNASTNTPTLVSSVGTNGYYYIVSVAGSTNLDGITDWKVGDWAIFAGAAWEKVDNTDSVSSVNGFTGAVSLTTDDISEGATNLYYTDTRARTAISLTTTGSSGASTYDNTTGVFNIPTYADAYVGTVTSVAAITLGTTGTDLSSTVANGTTTPVITLQVPTASASNRGALSSADWSTFNGKQSTITLTTTGTSGAATLVGSTLNVPNYADGGVLSLSAIGGTANANAATITGTVLNLQPADASFGGVVTTGAQTFAGAKTLTGALAGTSATFSGNAALGTTTLLSGGGAASWLTLNGTPYSGGIVYAVSSAAKGYSYYDNALNAIALQGNTGVGAALIVNGTTNALTIASTGEATFTSNLTLGSGATLYMTAGDIQFVSNAGYGILTADSNRLISIQNGAFGVNGAATFSSTIAASGRISTSHSTSGDYAAVFYNSSATGEGVTVRGGSTASHNAFIVQPYNGASTLFNILATGAATFSSSVTATSFFESSSIKGKDIIKTNPLTNLNLDVIQYTRKTDESKDVRYGYSAEQIHSLMPELTDKDVTAVKYLDVHTLLIAQLQQEIKELKAKLN